MIQAQFITFPGGSGGKTDSKTERPSDGRKLEWRLEEVESNEQSDNLAGGNLV